MSHKFRFSKESRARMESFAIGEAPATPDTEEEKPEQLEPEEQLPDEPLIVETRTDVGKVRASNQDALIDGEMLWGVADGMGTTLTVLWMSDHFAYIGHVGDSRVYLIRDGQFRQVTEDHSLVAELYRLGQLTREQAANHPMRNVITRAVGTEEQIETDLIVEERRQGDLWLICSDGLYGMVPDEQIEAVLKAHTPARAADLLMEKALEAGGRDNVSLVILLDREGGQ